MLKKSYLRLLVAVLSAVAMLFLLPAANASSANISHSYQSSVSIPTGSLVILDPAKANYVQPANSSNGSHLLGVVVKSSDSLLAIDTSPGEVQVATTGTAPTLVSSLNGNIGIGDEVAASPFDGIGMKADGSAPQIGIAQSTFSANQAGSLTRQVKDLNGASHQISIGYITLNIGSGLDQNSAAVQLTGLQKFAKSVTGKTVSNTRVVISLIVAFVAVLSLVVLIYAAIYGSIVSIGRNPLAKFSVFRALSSVLSMAAATLIFAAITIFLLLK